MKKTMRALLFVNPRRNALGTLAVAASMTMACGVPPEEIEEVAIETSTKALIQTSATAPAVGRNNTDGRLLFAYTVDNNGQRDIMGRLMNASGATIGSAFVISNDSLDESAPAVAGGGGKFLVTFTTKFSNTDTDPHAVLVDSATGALGHHFSLDTSFGTLHTGGRAVVLSATSFHCVYHSETELLSLNMTGDGVISNRTTVASRTSIQSPSLAYSSLSNRFILAWNSSRSEDIEITTRSGSGTWETPNRSTWPKEVCVEERCINSGDSVSVAWNVSTRKFGIAIGNDLSDSGRVEAFILPDTCSASSCNQLRSRICATPTGCNETFRLTQQPNLGDVAIAATGRNFAIGFVFGDAQGTDSKLSVVGMDETGLRIQTTPITSQPSPVKNPLLMSGSMASAGSGAVLGYRTTFDNSSATPVSMVTLDSRAAVTGVFGVAP